MTGILDVGGGTLVLDSNTGSWVMNGGTIRNAILNLQNATRLIFRNGTLDRVTVNTDLDLTGTMAANATILNGLVLNGTAFLGNQTTSSSYGYLSFNGNQALGGTGQVLFGPNTCNAVRLGVAETTLTNRVTLHGHSGQIGYAPACIGGSTTVSLFNEATISADVNGGILIIRASPFVNNGTTNQLNGGTLRINP